MLLQFAECTWTVTLVLLEVIDVPGIDRTIFLLLEMISFHVVLTSFQSQRAHSTYWETKPWVSSIGRNGQQTTYCSHDKGKKWEWNRVELRSIQSSG